MRRPDYSARTCEPRRHPRRRPRQSARSFSSLALLSHFCNAAADFAHRPLGQSIPKILVRGPANQAHIAAMGTVVDGGHLDPIEEVLLHDRITCDVRETHFVADRYRTIEAIGS